jgi:translation elongation factor EF-G
LQKKIRFDDCEHYHFFLHKQNDHPNILKNENHQILCFPNETIESFDSRKKIYESDQNHEKETLKKINLKLKFEESELFNNKIKERFSDNATEIIEYLNQYQPTFKEYTENQLKDILKQKCRNDPKNEKNLMQSAQVIYNILREGRTNN